MYAMPWYRDGLIWTVIGIVVAAFIMGLIVGQYVIIK
jgi:hypothetical protein